ncbi:hypothetical protein IMG5_151360 [Ichthyophthirius multifiliis]|uniref:Uncharacterized protein n=1 Tax=Ichthyophthirius multifiliis TaxID=5932 RepID=G0QYN9_ICHMU|nr:hypothetical protein IMG5_151360 [Ichthyophthirius multifiliis]EGR29666.1 hypothetical protein IMG5_151360 [Ichthyophthirius multifiliis]|eukprot:XP_004030902.1 hypothetical protein IMG5_151360 [Ichthyophthirius multifiliis]
MVISKIQLNLQITSNFPPLKTILDVNFQYTANNISNIYKPKISNKPQSSFKVIQKNTLKIRLKIFKSYPHYQSIIRKMKYSLKYPKQQQIIIQKILHQITQSKNSEKYSSKTSKNRLIPNNLFAQTTDQTKQSNKPNPIKFQHVKYTPKLTQISPLQKIINVLPIFCLKLFFFLPKYIKMKSGMPNFLPMACFWPLYHTLIKCHNLPKMVPLKQLQDNHLFRGQKYKSLVYSRLKNTRKIYYITRNFNHYKQHNNSIRRQKASFQWSRKKPLLVDFRGKCL